MSELENLKITVISPPTVDPGWVREAFVGLDLATDADKTVFAVAERGVDGTVRYEPLPQPTGFIECAGEPMAFWLPEGVTAASIGITTTD